MPATPSRRTLLNFALPALPLLALSACGSGSDSKGAKSSEASTPKGSTPADHGIVLDVRTEAEFGGGHLEGAQNYDVKSSDFDQQIGSLDKSKRYTVYCRSGNRSAKAVERMQALGFTDVQDAGGMQEAAKKLGLSVVK
ncbi:Thiosulfate sulfurtransferase PspE precursor [Actinomyces bovis]|uniref:Thiosulfate sulfurtransferase PspE n=1 Tax=Actinomyces bovis TaxID=1658 RepID=A0ABY1VPJ4_9ACTO|nr:rhodanese-like domain-containing protein [Actinomyces bovis]SPT54044.1 Thiosulfate sulfurtransferase PspE precursor [Actinomyces bovis]VEG53791.1 Thiosulfate sulfurtransferase PspE precursor [Actinomyces israelii]